MQTPSIGRIVHYRLTAGQADATNKRREGAQQNRAMAITERPGWQPHVGSLVDVGDIFPMIIARVPPGGDIINGQVILDGNDSLWVTDAVKGEEPGQWDWPTIQN